jgi:hypothetical protein
MNAQALSMVEPGQGRFERVLLWNLISIFIATKDAPCTQVQGKPEHAAAPRPLPAEVVAESSCCSGPCCRRTS